MVPKRFCGARNCRTKFAVALTAVRTQPNVTQPFYAVGGRRLDQNFLASLVAPAGMRTLLYLNLDQSFIPSDITNAAGAGRSAGAVRANHRENPEAASPDGANNSVE